MEQPEESPPTRIPFFRWLSDRFINRAIERAVREKFPQAIRSPEPIKESQLKTVCTQTFQSRWGYHPVSYTDYLFLKAIHKRYWSSLVQAYKWQRWSRKKPHNRKGVEPKTDPTFIYHDIDPLKILDYFTVGTAKSTRTHYLRFKRLYPHIVTDFLNARIPSLNPKGCIPVDMSKYESLRSTIS